MAMPSKLEQIARERGISTFELVSEAVEKGKSVRAAAKYIGVPQTSIQWWMLRNKCTLAVSAKLTKESAHE